MSHRIRLLLTEVFKETLFVPRHVDTRHQQVRRGNLNLKGSTTTSLGELQRVMGDLDLTDSLITSLGKLRRVDGSLHLLGTKITSLDSLESVGDSLWVSGVKLTSLGNLKHVGGTLSLLGAPITSLDNLEYVGGNLGLAYTKLTSLDSLKYVGGYLDLRRTPITRPSIEHVGKYVNLNNTPVISLDGLKNIGGSIKLKNTPDLKQEDIPKRLLAKIRYRGLKVQESLFIPRHIQQRHSDYKNQIKKLFGSSDVLTVVWDATIQYGGATHYDEFLAWVEGTLEELNQQLETLIKKNGLVFASGKERFQNEHIYVWVIKGVKDLQKLENLLNDFEEVFDYHKDQPWNLEFDKEHKNKLIHRLGPYPVD